MLDFNAEILERSRTIPVVVDFWAAWCGPCEVLGPVVEALAAEADGRWELVKIDVEEHVRLAQDCGVRSIPAIMMFHDGKVVAEFVGVRPAEEIRRWLDANLPDPRLARLTGIVAGWESRGSELVPELEAFVEAHPDLPAGRLRLAQAVVTRDPARARRLVQEVEADADLAELAGHVTGLADLMDCGGDLPQKVASHVEGAKSTLAAHDLGGTLGHLVDLAMVDRQFGGGLARRATVALFNLLGQDHELTRAYRQRLAMALHS